MKLHTGQHKRSGGAARLLRACAGGAVTPETGAPLRQMPKQGALQ